MFERNKNKQVEPSAEVGQTTRPAAAPASPNPATARSNAMIGPSIEIKGTVTGDEDLLIQGKVEGTIELRSHAVTVGQSGRVLANVQAKTVTIDGEVEGDVTGSEKVMISKSGRVRGNIVAPRVTLEDGALFKGSIDMDPGDAAGKPVSLAAEKPASGTADNKLAPELDLKSG